MHRDTNRCIDFLRNIGLTVNCCEGVDGFTPGVDIRDGVLIVDKSVATPSNLLHEAGHLATVPGRFRGLFQRDVQQGQRLMLEIIDQEGVEIDSPVYRAVMQCSDTEATAWAWAAGRHLGLEPKSIIRDGEYAGSGAEIRLCLQTGAYAGINGLSRAGFCVTRAFQARVSGLPVYPNLAMWVQP